MSAIALAERLAPMTDDDTTDDSRGGKIKDRMRSIGLTNKAMAKEARMDRQTVARAIVNDPATTRTTYERLEGCLDRLERELGHGAPDAVMSTEQGLIEFEVSGDFGVRVIVKGPIENATELEESVARLIRDIRETD